MTSSAIDKMFEIFGPIFEQNANVNFKPIFEQNVYFGHIFDNNMYFTNGKEARQQHRQRRHQGSRRGLGQITRPGPCDKARPPCHKNTVLKFHGEIN